MSHNYHVQGYLFVTCAVMGYGSAGILGRMMYQYEADPLTVAFLRALTACLLLAFGLLCFQRSLFRIKRSSLPLLALYGFLGMFCTPLCFLSAIKYTTVSTATILFNSAPAVVVLLSVWLFRESLTRRTSAAVLLTLAGAALVAQCYRPESLQFELTGILFGCGACVSMALFTVCGKYVTHDYPSWTVVFYGGVAGAGFLGIFRAFQGPLTLHHPPAFWGWLLLQALLPAILADVCYLGSLRYLDAGKVSILTSFQVVVAPLLAWLFLGETLTILQFLGAGLVLAGILVLRHPSSSKVSTLQTCETPIHESASIV